MKKLLAELFDQRTWDVQTGEEICVHHLGFRELLNDFFGEPFRDPRLEWYYDGGELLSLRLYRSVGSVLTKSTAQRLARSLRKMVESNVTLPSMARIVRPNSEIVIMNIGLSHVSTHQGEPEALCDPTLNTLRVIIHSIEEAITEWLRQEAEAIISADPVINEKAPNGVRPYVNDNSEWGMIF